MMIEVKASSFRIFSGVAALVAVAAVGACSSADGGPLDASVWHDDITVGTRSVVGEIVGVGGPMLLVNGSDADIVVTDVELVDSDAHLALDDWILRDVAGRSATGTQRPFPPKDARPASLRTVEPTISTNDDGTSRGDVEVVVAVSTSAAGEHSARGVRITYSGPTGDRHIVFPLTIVVCADPAELARDCPSWADR
jgi:hypothetical protein